MKINCIYKTTNLINGKYYIGKFSSGTVSGTKYYIGSEKLFLEAVKIFGKDNFKNPEERKKTSEATRKAMILWWKKRKEEKQNTFFDDIIIE